MSGREISPTGSFTDGGGGGDTGGTPTGGGPGLPPPPDDGQGAGSGETPWLDGYFILDVTTGQI
jgi:hypothetical protein